MDADEYLVPHGLNIPPLAYTPRTRMDSNRVGAPSQPLKSHCLPICTLEVNSHPLKEHFGALPPIFSCQRSQTTVSMLALATGSLFMLYQFFIYCLFFPTDSSQWHLTTGQWVKKALEFFCNTQLQPTAFVNTFGMFWSVHLIACSSSHPSKTKDFSDILSQNFRSLNHKSVQLYQEQKVTSSCSQKI